MCLKGISQYCNQAVHPILILFYQVLQVLLNNTILRPDKL